MDTRTTSKAVGDAIMQALQRTTEVKHGYRRMDGADMLVLGGFSFLFLFLWLTLSFQSLCALLVGVCAVGAGVYLHWKRFRKRGLIRYLPDGIQEQLLHQTLLDWMKDATLSNKLKQYAPLLLGLTESETKLYLDSAPRPFRNQIMKPGLVHFLPGFLRGVLLPESDTTMAEQESSAGNNTNSDVDPKWAETLFRILAQKRVQQVVNSVWNGFYSGKIRQVGMIVSLAWGVQTILSAASKNTKAVRLALSACILLVFLYERKELPVDASGEETTAVDPRNDSANFIDTPRANESLILYLLNRSNTVWKAKKILQQLKTIFGEEKLKVLLTTAAFLLSMHLYRHWRRSRL
eukprot:gb/GECG01002664.1/.p1 GENE.gb/GECG01002664.1/~~gb/GECG01002664.1/.p1  ORF type:complete len:349 (+),score=40.09 gb/GECG01002664.1/:1-1047(+)